MMQLGLLMAGPFVAVASELNSQTMGVEVVVVVETVDGVVVVMTSAISVGSGDILPEIVEEVVVAGLDLGRALRAAPGPTPGQGLETGGRAQGPLEGAHLSGEVGATLALQEDHDPRKFQLFLSLYDFFVIINRWVVTFLLHKI